MDVEAAFDSTWGGSLWKMLKSIAVDPTITSLNEAICDNVECPAVINGQLREWFKEEIGVRQG